MANGIKIGDPRGFNKERSSKFHEGFRVRQTPEEGRRTYRPKRCGNSNKDEDNSPKTLYDNNHHTSSEKFRQFFDCQQTRTEKVIYEPVLFFACLSPHIFFVLLVWFVRWDVSDREAAFSWDIASRIYLKKKKKSTSHRWVVLFRFFLQSYHKHPSGASLETVELKCINRD